MDRPPSGMLGEGAPPAAAVASGGGARADNGPPPNLGGARYDAATGVTHHSHLPITPMATSSIEAGGGRGGVVRRQRGGAGRARGRALLSTGRRLHGLTCTLPCLLSAPSTAQLPLHHDGGRHGLRAGPQAG